MQGAQPSECCSFDTGEILAYTINPDKNFWLDKDPADGRAPQK